VGNRAAWAVSLAGVAAAWLLSAAPAMGASCTTSWQVVPGAAVNGALSDVSASSATDAWAVGMWGRKRTLAEHWTGTRWRRVPTPNPGRRLSLLQAVADVSPTDAWAVGQFGAKQHAALLLHWNGTRWRRVALPSNARNATFEDMTVVSPTDIWAVGTTRLEFGTRTLHYNGTRWALVPAPSSSAGTLLVGAGGSAGNDVWAVGLGLVEHWTGSAWHVVPAPSRAHLSSVVAISPTDAWASGAGPGAAMHWDGGSWTRSLKTGAKISLDGIAASSSTDVWAVGSNFNQPGPNPGRPEVAHWNGAGWTRSLLHSGTTAGLVAIANAPGTTTFWAVGSTMHAASSTPRIEERC
jgi:hypothetical protein